MDMSLYLLRIRSPLTATFVATNALGLSFLVLLLYFVEEVGAFVLESSTVVAQPEVCC